MSDDLGSSGLNGFSSDDDWVQQNWIRNAIQNHESSLLRYAQHFVHDEELARDVVQDTFLQLCRQTDNEIQTRVAQWLFTVCRNRAIDVCRKEGRMKLARDNLLVQQTDSVPGPKDVAELKETAEGLAKQISRLPDNLQEVLRLKFHAGLSYKEIAEVTGLSKTNVGFLLHKAISRLREKLTHIPTRPSET